VTDGDTLLAAILANPEEDTPRLMYADALQERGDEARAEFIRVQCEIARLGLPDPRECDRCHSASIRTTRMRARNWDGWEYCLLHARERELLPVNGRSARAWFDGPWWGDGLCNVCPDQSVTIIDPATGARYDPPPRMRYQFFRGFVSSLTCTAADWLAHADKLHWHPSQTVPCPECKGGKGVGHFSGIDYGPCPTCGREGHISRPCPETAQPLTAVTLTGGQVPWNSAPSGDGCADYFLLIGLGREMRHGKSVRLPRGKPHTEIIKAVLEAEWPGITFTLPPEAPTLHGFPIVYSPTMSGARDVTFGPPLV
jgi:uncharacterized protein (TIGR02996 family)